MYKLRTFTTFLSSQSNILNDFSIPKIYEISEYLSPSIIKNQVFSQSLVKYWFTINYIQMIINEFLLNYSL